MGKLAKIGIIRGKKVPIDGVLRSQQAQQEPGLNAFEKSSLESFGFAEIGERVAMGAQLEAHEIERLLAKAPLSVLVKLVELKNDLPVRPDLVPCIYLPLEAWMRSDDVQGAFDIAAKRIEQSGWKAPWIFTDIIDFFDLESEWPDLISELLRSYPGVQLVAPPVGVILKWISFHHRVRSREDRFEQLEAVLRTLSDIGFTGLAESAYRHSLPIVQRSKFSGCVLTRLDRHSSSKSLTEDLLRVRELASHDEGGLAWCTGVPHGRGRDRFAGVSLDMLALRVLAVGTLALNNVSKRRGYTRYLQPETVQLMPKLGVNEYMFAAVDLETVERFGLPLFGDSAQVLEESAYP